MSNLTKGQGLDAALKGVDAVVDAISSPPVGPDETREYFCTTTRNLLAAEQRAGVRHHVLLTIVGIHRMALSTCLRCNGNSALGGSGAVEVRASGGFRRPGDVVPGGEAVGHLGAIVIGGEPMAAGPEVR